jgi:hypothetical protein
MAVLAAHRSSLLHLRLLATSLCSTHGHLVGLILNEETGHIIGIGKATYNRLVDAGYVVDEVTGTIAPPPPSPDSPRRLAKSGGKVRRRHAA